MNDFYSAVFFDMDGLFVNSEPQWLLVETELMAEFGYEWTSIDQNFCLGGPLARLEMGISLPALFERFKDIELASTPKRRPTFVLRGYESVDISAALG